MSWYRFFIPPESAMFGDATTYYDGDNLDPKKERNNLGEEKIEKIKGDDDEEYDLVSTIKDDWRDVYLIFWRFPRSEICKVFI